MMLPASPTTNFTHLQEHDEQLMRLGLLAEKYFEDDPNTCLLKLRQLAELLTQLAAARAGLFESAQKSQYDRLRRLQDHGILRRVETLFALANRLGSRLTTARKQRERLIPALSGKDFPGELVPQDPDDETASVLLGRILAARAFAEGCGINPRRRRATMKSKS